MKIWVGEEKEGIHKCLKTLFIKGKAITFKEIEEVINNFEIKQLYFGAGVCSDINEEVIKKCIKQYHSKLIITVEVKLNILSKYIIKPWFKKCKKIIMINDSDFLLFKKLNDDDEIKLQSIYTKQKILYMFQKKKAIITDTNKLKGIKYKGDMVIK